MHDRAITPSTIVGIKRLAKSIKRELSIPHHEALDVAARKAGFENFRDANKKLAEPKANNSDHAQPPIAPTSS